MNRIQKWRLLILSLACFALLGLQIIEATHHHDTAAPENACGICQLAAHQVLDLTLPGAALAPPTLLLLFVLPVLILRCRAVPAPRLAYDSRAPPAP